MEDSNNNISSFAYVSPNAELGKGNTICEGVIIRGNVKIGDNNYIGPYCIIGDQAESVDWIQKSTNEVIIGNNNHFFKQVSIDGGTEQKTSIGDFNYFLKNAHVGHDATINNYVRLSCNSCIGGWSVLLDSVNVGLNASIKPRLIIGENVRIGMNAAVTKNAEKDYIYVGVPAKILKKNIK